PAPPGGHRPLGRGRRRGAQLRPRRRHLPPGPRHPARGGVTTRPARYDSLGRGYARFRRPDPRIAAAIEDALGDAGTIVDVGSGTGPSQPGRGRVIAVEPSRTMIDQRPPDAAPAVQGVAEHLPFPDDSFDAALAVLTTHHWSDHRAGLRELARVSGR